MISRSIRDRPIICTDLQIRTTFGFRWVGGFEEAGCSDFGPGYNLYTCKSYHYCEDFLGRECSDLEVGGWVSQPKSEHCSDL